MERKPLRAVIDTNVLLDFWVFDDPRSRPLRAALEDGRLLGLRSADTDAELQEVLGRPAFAARLAAATTDVAAVLARWQALAAPVAHVTAAPWACSDPLDQKFIDLAVATGADLLVSKDREVLRLARRARERALAIVDPVAADRYLPAAVASR